MDGMGGMGMFMDIGQAGLKAWTGPKIKKNLRQAGRIEDDMRRKANVYQDRQYHLAEKDVNRQFHQVGEKRKAIDSVERGLSRGSSIPTANQGNLTDERQRRAQQISERRAFENNRYNDQSMVIYHKKKAKDLAETVDWINSIIDGGAGGAIESYGSL